ncbi:hypothetical protein [Georgenia halophila]
MASFRTLGRLLFAGLIGGSLVGGFVGGVATWSASRPGDLVLGASVGVALGLFFGLTIQAVAHVLIMGMRRLRPSAGVRSRYVVAVVVPFSAAMVAAGWVATWSGLASTMRALVILGGAAVLSAVVLWLTVRWCLSPPEEPRGRKK